MINIIKRLFLFLLFTLCACDVKMPDVQKISAKDFVHKLCESLDNSEKLKNLQEVYQNEIYGDVAFSEPKAFMSYLIVHSDMEKRKLPAEILADYKERKEKFKCRLSLVSTKETLKSTYSPDKHKTSNDLEMFYAEFLKMFMSSNSTYFRDDLLEKIKNGKVLDHVDKAFFWMYYVNNPNPFYILAETLDIKILPIKNSTNLIILFGEEENTGISYEPYYYNLETRRILRCTSDKGERINFLPSYDKDSVGTPMRWKDSILT
jgi:hypothetical protein